MSHEAPASVPGKPLSPASFVVVIVIVDETKSSSRLTVGARSKAVHLGCFLQ